MSFFTSGNHWYQVDAKGAIAPAHDIDLREARKINAYPSITTILKERANPALDKWKQDELFNAVVDNKRKKGESEDDYRERIATIAQTKGREAAEFGTRLHDALDVFPQITIDSDLAPYIELFAPTYHRHVRQRIASEIMLADTEIGVAGRTDLIAETEWGLAIIDYKTSKFKGGKASFWPSYRIQLAFYAKAYQKLHNLAKPPACINVGINSLAPTEPVWKVYTVEEQEAAYAEFLAIAFLWFSTKNYWPVSNHRWTAHFNVNGKLQSA